MSCTLVLAASFRTLKQRLIEEVRRRSSLRPLDPQWICVPNSTLSSFLQLQLATESRNGVLAGVRVVPLNILLSRLQAGREAPCLPREGPAMEYLLYELCRRIPDDSPLRRVREVTSGYGLLIPTFLDLAEGGFGPEQRDLLDELASDAGLDDLERETLRIYSAWLDLLKAATLDWAPLRLQQLADWILTAENSVLNAGLAAEEGQSPSLHVYGFYDFTDVSLQAIAALARRIEVTVFFPMDPSREEAHPGYSFAAPVLQDLRLRLGASGLAERPEPANVESESTRFFLDTFPEGDIPHQPEGLTWQRASGVRSELISAALRIRRWLDSPSDPLRPEEILVVAPQIESYVNVAREIFGAFAIPLCILDRPTRSTPESRSLTGLLKIWADSAPVEWVLHHLRDHPELATRRGFNLNRFESEMRRLPIWGGEGWRALLDIPLRGNAESSSYLPRFTETELAFIREIVELWIEGPREKATPEEALRHLQRINSGWLELPTLLKPLLEALEMMRKLRPEATIPIPLLRSMAAAAAEGTLSDSMADGGVVLAPLMRARGVTSRGLILLGLAAGQLPFRIDEDPLLSDNSRRRLLRLARDVGHRLPVKTSATAEMTLLFLLMNTSSERVHWVIPETDEAGRQIAPTPWVQRYIRHWFPTADADHPQLARIPRGPAGQAHFLYGLDASSGQLLPPVWAACLNPGREEFRRDSRGYNGHIPAAAFASGPVLDRVRVTELESLARCPYRFYAQSVARWRPLESVAFTEQLEGMAWGSLVHGVLQWLMEPYRDKGATLREVIDELMSGQGALLARQIDSLPPELSVSITLMPRVLGNLLRRRLYRTIAGYLTFAALQDSLERRPVGLEQRRSRRFPGLAGVEVSGQLDRVDETDDACFVVDYKSGRSPWTTTGMDKDVELKAGYRMQPHLYPWLLQEEGSQRQQPAFSYVFLGNDPPRIEPVESSLPAESLLEPLAEVLLSGSYFPLSNEGLESLEVSKMEPCRWCDCISLCRRFEVGTMVYSPRFFAGEAPQRMSMLVQLAGSKS